MRSVVVTGVSSGIGLETTRLLLKQGFRVFGSVRRDADARRLSAELGSAFTPLKFDVTDDAAVAAAAGQVRQGLDGVRLAGLVNNAGLVLQGPLAELPIEDFRRQIAVNLIGQLSVTQAFLPLLGTDPALRGQPGRIIMISSVAGHLGIAFLGAYAASKHALEGMSKSLRQELMLFGIDVVVVAPGTVAGPADSSGTDAPPNGSPFGLSLARYRQSAAREVASGIPVGSVSKTILQALTAHRPKPRYIVAKAGLIHRLIPMIPSRIIDRAVSRALRLRSPNKKAAD